MLPLAARRHAGLAAVYERASRRDKAEEHLSQARRMCRAMGMRYWLDRLEIAAVEPASS
jgi:hypothetical protein